MASEPRHISTVLGRLLADLQPPPTQNGPVENHRPAPLPALGRPQLTLAPDGKPTRYTFARFHEQTAHLTPPERLYVFLALPEACRAQMWGRPTPTGN